MMQVASAPSPALRATIENLREAAPEPRLKREAEGSVQNRVFLWSKRFYLVSHNSCYVHA